jgi:SSS family solute:Na+ symporter
MLSYIAPPIVAAFLLGIFGKRVNGNGAFTGLIAGLAMAVFLLFFRKALFGSLHFLLVVPILLAISMVIIYTVSLTGRKPAPEKLQNTIFSIKDLQKEVAGLLSKGWYKNYLFWSIILLVACAAIWIIFG